MLMMGANDATMQAAGMARRRTNRWRSPVTLNEIATPILLAALNLIPALALEAAGWEIDLSIVTPSLLFSVLIGVLLARSRFRELTSLVLSLVYGCCITLIVAGAAQDLPFLDGIAAVFARFVAWAGAAASGGINTDSLALTLLVALLFWCLGFNGSWHCFRVDRVWRVILPPGLALLANLVITGGMGALESHLIAYTLLSLALIIRSTWEAREWEWSLRAVRVPRSLRPQFALIGILLSLLSLAVAWGMPRGDLQDRLEAFQEFLASDPLQELTEQWTRLFAPVISDGPATTDFYGADLLKLGGAISLGDEIVLLVEADDDGSRRYWRSRVFERYIDGQWSPSADLRITDRSAPLEMPMNAEVRGMRREEVRHNFIIGDANARVFYAAPQPSSINSAGRIDLIYTDKPTNSSMNVSVARPLGVMRSGETYQASSWTSVATAHDLRRASATYPEWVSGANLYIGAPNLRVLELARGIIAEAEASNPYDQAKAIESWLRRNIRYNEAISAPPDGVDAVEWVLFEAREGYCTYYATSMIVMLRHLGIPARLAAGFSQGQYDEASGRFVVREREAHTWVEVYFPEYGWIEFEPTAAEEPLNREGDRQFDTIQQPLDEAPTASPTPTPTPSATPTATPASRQAGADPPETEPSPSPSPTPSPTAPPAASPTPYIVPTWQPPEIQDDPPPQPPDADLEPLALFALAATVSILLIIVIGLLLLWWWEWRGLRGMSPISRAYARLERYIALLGINVGASKTTLEKRRELAARIPAAREPIQTISDLYTRERYGAVLPADDLNQTQNRRAERAWQRTRGNIIRRWLGRLLPFRPRN